MLLTLFILSLTVGIFSLLSLSDAFILFAWIHLGLALFSAGLLVLRRGRDGEARLVLPGSRSLSKFVNYLLVIILAILSYQAVGRFLKFEYDATSNKAHSLALESLNVLSSINEKVEILGFFLGAKPPEHIAELLNKFTRNSSNITWRGLDPDKERPLVEAYGISEKDTLFIKKINDNTTGIKVSRDINEETLTNALRKLVSGRKANILTLSGHGEGDITNDKEVGFLFLKEAIEGEGYKVPTSVTLTSVDLKPSKESFLLLIAPTTSYLPEELTQIKNYFENGGSGLILLEPNRNADLSGLLSGLGFKIGNDIIVDKEMFTMGESRLGVQPIVDSYSKHGAVDGFKKSIVFSTLRSVRKEPMADSVQELAFTSESSWGETNLVDLYSKSPKALKDESDNQGPISIAATLEREVGGLKQRLVVIGDSEFAANINLRQLFNRDFILNLVNWAIGEDTPVTIRAGTLEKSEIVISERTYMLLFMFLGILLPELLILWSVFMWGKRRS
jgi:hypothetical protein